MEAERLDHLKASRMKEIAFKRQTELEHIFARAHIEIDTEAARERILSLIDSGSVEPTDLLADMDNQIEKAKEEATSRKEILDKVEKWMSACEEESWLEDYNRVMYLSLCFSCPRRLCCLLVFIYCLKLDKIINFFYPISKYILTCHGF